MTELMPWHKNYLIQPDYSRVDLVKEGANSQAQIKLFKSKGDLPMDQLKDIVAKMKPEHQAQINLVLKQKDDTIAALEEEVKKAKAEPVAPVAGQTEEEILKSVKDPAVKALLETQIAKAKAAEEVAKQLKDEQDAKEAIAKAKEVPNIGAEENQLAEVYKKLQKVDKTLCDDVFGIFKAASALVNEGGVLKEIGKSAGTNTDPAGNTEDAWAQIEKAAEKIAKESNISQASAIAKACKENPELYKQYLDAQMGR